MAILTSVRGVNAPTQTSSTGWFYADADPEPSAMGWDGRLWPEIVGYRGQAAKARVEPFDDLPPMFEVVALPPTDPLAPLLESPVPETIDGDVALEPDMSARFAYAEPVVEAGSAKLGHIFAILAVVLVFIALAVGVIL